MKFNLLSRAAAATLAAAGAGDPDAAPEPGQGGSDANEEEEDEAGEPAGDPPAAAKKDKKDKASADAAVDVVSAADVKSLTDAAHAKGFAEANARMKSVFDSPEGKADASTAVFLLATSNGSADDIIGHLKGRSPTPAPAASATIPDTKVNIATDPQALAEAGASADADKGWDAALEKRAQASAPLVPAAHAGAQGTIPARAIPRTGN